MSKVPAEDRGLRVLLVTPDYPPAHGGIQRLLHRITLAMPNAETRVLTLQHPDAMTFDTGQRQAIQRVISFGRSPIVRNVVFNVSASLCAPRWTPDVILNGHVVSGIAAALLARRYKAANILYTYGKEVAGRARMTAWALKHSDAGVTISEFTLSQIVEVCGGALPAPVTIVPPGVDIPEHLADVTREARPTILTMSRLRDWYKGHDRIIDALPTVLALIPDAQWIVIGDGRIRSALERRAQQVGVADSVRFVGSVTDEERDMWLAQAHVFVMPARYPKEEIGGEGFGMVYLEAAAWGLPSIAGNVGAAREAVLDGTTGLLVDPESSAEIAQAIVKLLSNPALARALGQQARARVIQNFRWEQAGRQLEQLLLSTVRIRRRRETER